MATRIAQRRWQMTPHRAQGNSANSKAAHGTAPEPQPVVFHPHVVEVVGRPEGYREFRCLAATWSYPEARPLAALFTELWSGQKGVDKDGNGIASEFWSGSDVALRLRAAPSDDLALRELILLASRRSA